MEGPWNEFSRDWFLQEPYVIWQSLPYLPLCLQSHVLPRGPCWLFTSGFAVSIIQKWDYLFMSRACQHYMTRLRPYIIQTEKSELIYVNNVFNCTTPGEAQGAMWVTCPSKAMQRHEGRASWLDVCSHNITSCSRPAKFPKDLCQISSLVNDRKDEDLSQLSWVRLYPTLLHGVLLLFLSIKLESREIPASQDKHFSDHRSDSRLWSSPRVHDICNDPSDIHYCCAGQSTPCLTRARWPLDDGNSPSWGSSRP